MPNDTIFIVKCAKKKPPFCDDSSICSASISRILSGYLRILCSHLSRRVVANTLKRHFPLAEDTALHPSKDLAVSPLVLPRGLIRFKADASFFRPKRLCSHLAPCGGWGLPTTLLTLITEWEFGLSSAYYISRRRLPNAGQVEYSKEAKFDNQFFHCNLSIGTTQNKELL